MSPDPGERARHALLYVIFVGLLVSGGLWYLRTAPDPGEDPRVALWRRSAVEQLPDLPLQVAADTMVMAENGSAVRTTSVAGGSYDLTMICLGDGGRVRVRLSTTSRDTGRGIPCAQPPSQVTVTVGLDANFFMEVAGETDGTAVFRWRQDRSRGV